MKARGATHAGLQQADQEEFSVGGKSGPKAASGTGSDDHRTSRCRRKSAGGTEPGSPKGSQRTT